VQPVYFDTSVFTAIFKGEANAPKIKELLIELKREKVRIYTSIITVQEVSVEPYRRGTLVEDRFEKVDKIARIEGVTKEISLTAAKFEAHIKDDTSAPDSEENKRRKWDCFHIATAMALKCSVLYTTDKGQMKRKAQFNITGMDFQAPEPSKPTLFSGTANETTTN
jgi:predicted nucleic acid-binding protein